MLYGEKGVIGRFWDVQEEWGKVCAGEVVVKGVPTGHFIPEGEFGCPFFVEPLLIIRMIAVGALVEMDTDVLVSLILDHFKGSS